jgi:ubiquitin carboxyl-terminal hydrolase L5
MAMYETEEEAFNFNLLALYGDPLGRVRRDLATNIRCLETLDDKWSGDEAWPAPGEGEICSLKSNKLGDYDLTATGICLLTGGSSKWLDFHAKICKSKFEIPEAIDLRNHLCKEQVDICNNYRSTKASPASAQIAVSGRKKDHTPAIHEWVKKLIDHGVLAQLHEQVQK